MFDKNKTLTTYVQVRKTRRKQPGDMHTVLDSQSLKNKPTVTTQF